MAKLTVEFQFITGLKRAIFRNARLRGSWDASGRYSDDWSESPMRDEIGTDGCPIFKTAVQFDLADQGKMFKWGVILDGPQGANFWGIPTEVQDINSVERHRQFQLNGGGTGPETAMHSFVSIRTSSLSAADYNRSVAVTLTSFTSGIPIESSPSKDGTATRKLLSSRVSTTPHSQMVT